MHPLVITIEVVFRSVKTVRIFHREFANPDQAGPGPGLVAVLGLDLVDHARQLTVGRHFGPREVHHRFLVGHPKEHVFVVAVLKPKQLRPHRGVAARFLPQLPGQHHRHEHFLAFDRVHLFAEDRLDLGGDPPPEREQGVDPGGHRSDVAAPQQKDVAWGLGLFGHLFDLAAHQPGHAHGRVLLSAKGPAW